jgi:hypothetical protein
MNEEIIKRAIQEFAKSNEQKYEKTFLENGNSTEMFTIKLERKNLALANESEARANTISALPSGSQCYHCGGSGRAR